MNDNDDAKARIAVQNQLSCCFISINEFKEEANGRIIRFIQKDFEKTII